jgi:hypothetical protein
MKSGNKSPKEGDLRVWHMANPPSEPFLRSVDSLEEACKVLTLLADRDLSLGAIVSHNAQGLQVYEAREWVEWESFDGDDILTLMREGKVTEVSDIHRELQMCLEQMRHTSTTFYSMAIRTGNHAFIEFCGLMNAYIDTCYEAAKDDLDFRYSNTHTGRRMPGHKVEYILEKLECIYGLNILEQGSRNARVEGEVRGAERGGGAAEEDVEEGRLGPGSEDR